MGSQLVKVDVKGFTESNLGSLSIRGNILTCYADLLGTDSLPSYTGVRGM